jgi:hypothetical protein
MSSDRGIGITLMAGDFMQNLPVLQHKMSSDRGIGRITLMAGDFMQNLPVLQHREEREEHDLGLDALEDPNITNREQEQLDSDEVTERAQPGGPCLILINECSTMSPTHLTMMDARLRQLTSKDDAAAWEDLEVRLRHLFRKYGPPSIFLTIAPSDIVVSSKSK